MVALSLFSKIGQVGFQAGGYLCSEIQKNMEQRPATTEEYQRKVNILVEYINNHLIWIYWQKCPVFRPGISIG